MLRECRSAGGAVGRPDPWLVGSYAVGVLFGVEADLAAALNTAWGTLAGVGAGSLVDRWGDHKFRRRVRATLEGVDAARATAFRRLLDDSALPGLVAEPDNRERVQAVDAARLAEVVRDCGGDVQAVADALAEAFAAAAVHDAEPIQQLLVGKADRLNETLEWTLITALDLHDRFDRFEADLARLASWAVGNLADVLDGAPVPADEAVADARFRMRSDVTDDKVPAYIPRDVDADLDSRLAQVAATGGLVAVAGRTKTAVGRGAVVADQGPGGARRGARRRRVSGRCGVARVVARGPASRSVAEELVDHPDERLACAGTP